MGAARGEVRGAAAPQVPASPVFPGFELPEEGIILLPFLPLRPACDQDVAGCFSSRPWERLQCSWKCCCWGGEHRGRVPLHPGEATAVLQAGLGAPCRSVLGADASPGQGAEGFVSAPCPHCHSILAASCWMACVGCVHNGELGA